MGRPDRPLDPGAGPLAAFAAQLRELRAQAGNPTYRTLAEQTHYSATTLSDAAGGRKQPTLPVTLAFVRACGGDEQQWRERWQELTAALSATASEARSPGGAVTPIQTREPHEPAPPPHHETDTSGTGNTQPAPTRRRRGTRARVAAIPLTVAAAVVTAVFLRPGPGQPTASPGMQHRSASPTPSAPAQPQTGAPPSPSADPAGAVSIAPVAAVSPATRAAAATSTPPSTPAAVTWSAYSGPKCHSSGAAAFSLHNASGASAPWHATAVSGPEGYSGCQDPQYTHLSGQATTWQNHADWVFTPGGAVTSCRFQIYVPTGTWAASVLYEAYPGDTDNGYNGAPITSFTLDQHTYDAGGWASSPAVSFSTGVIDLEITDAGTTTKPGAAADVVQATCT